MRAFLMAATAALIATAVTATSSTIHHKHHRHHGHPATTAQKQHSRETWRTLSNAYGQYTEPRHPSSEGGGGGYWNGLHYIPNTFDGLWQQEHPSNQWMPHCYSNSYAVCGRDSLANRQDGNSTAY